MNNNKNNNNLVCPSPEFTELMRAVGKATVTFSALDPMTDAEITCIRELLRGRPDVPFTLMQLFGLYWEFVISPKRLGLRFRRAVKLGKLPEIYLDPHHKGQTKKYRVRQACDPGLDLVP